MFNYESVNLVNGNERKFKKERENKKIKNRFKKLIRKTLIKNNK